MVTRSEVCYLLFHIIIRLLTVLAYVLFNTEVFFSTIKFPKNYIFYLYTFVVYEPGLGAEQKLSYSQLHVKNTLNMKNIVF